MGYPIIWALFVFCRIITIWISEKMEVRWILMKEEDDTKEMCEIIWLNYKGFSYFYSKVENLYNEICDMENSLWLYHLEELLEEEIDLLYSKKFKLNDIKEELEEKIGGRLEILNILGLKWGNKLSYFQVLVKRIRYLQKELENIKKGIKLEEELSLSILDKVKVW